MTFFFFCSYLLLWFFLSVTECVRKVIIDINPNYYISLTRAPLVNEYNDDPHRHTIHARVGAAAAEILGGFYWDRCGHAMIVFRDESRVYTIYYYLYT